ncbi:MAG: peptidase S8 [Chitinophagaceae bacterium]|nr:MAG: peptidase S8 [Chitinophagaceae bacterium]
MKRVFLVCAGIAMLSITAKAQAKEDATKNWYLKDQKVDNYYGISLDKAYDFLKSKNLKSKTVIVGIVDSGIDTLHEDLKPVLWVNKKEIPGNGIDDDKNGYIDDINGWNFLGNKNPKENVTKDSYESARVYHQYKSKYEGVNIDVNKLSKEEQYIYNTWKRAAEEVKNNSAKSNTFEFAALKKAYDNCVNADSVLRKSMGKEEYNGNELAAHNSNDLNIRRAKTVLYGLMAGNQMLDETNKSFLEGLGGYVRGEESKAQAATIAPPTYRASVVKDNYSDINDQFYGNGNVLVDNESAVHGTHVAGIVGAARNNGIGVDGVADNVKIMAVRAVPDGDEHDKDIALGIRYAVDNGAKVINMSFGKSFSPEKKWVDDAIKYAEKKGVLLIHAAGNDAKNLDEAFNFPSTVLLDGSRPNNWITVGASGDPAVDGLVANFSNYGKKEVDIFAPGVKIYNTVPGGNNYRYLQGTSMASPVVAGVAALVMSYYPNLSAEQVKEILLKSAVVPEIEGKNPATSAPAKLADLSVTGGIVNAYEAVKLAYEISSKSQHNVPENAAVIPTVKKTAKKPVKKAVAKKKATKK